MINSGMDARKDDIYSRHYTVAMRICPLRRYSCAAKAVLLRAIESILSLHPSGLNYSGTRNNIH